MSTEQISPNTGPVRQSPPTPSESKGKELASKGNQSNNPEDVTRLIDQKLAGRDVFNAEDAPLIQKLQGQGYIVIQV
ncbi:MAG: hypothetical protein LBB14_01375 [Puniceicoccales bacterium]|jgi:hypothetical protein|nr:hypothetical protein [Puniceicoccales bacterium]